MDDITKLKKLCNRLDIHSEDLDALVDDMQHDLATERAEEINDAGLDAQLEYIHKVCGRGAEEQVRACIE